MPKRKPQPICSDLSPSISEDDGNPGIFIIFGEWTSNGWLYGGKKDNVPDREGETNSKKRTAKQTVLFSIKELIDYCWSESHQTLIVHASSAEFH